MSETDPTLDLAESTLGFVDTYWGENSLYGEGLYGQGLYAGAFAQGEGMEQPLLHHRDDDRHYDSDERFRQHELRDNAVVGASFVATDPTPVGTEYDHDVESTVDMRVEATGGRNGVVNGSAGFRQLTTAVKNTILANRSYPFVDEAYQYSYHWLQILNENDQSEDDREYYRLDFEVVYHGYEGLP